MKKGLSIEKHRAIGSQLKGMTAGLQRLVVDFNVYPKRSRSVILAKRAEETLWKLRSKLEGQMSKEHGDPLDFNIYYGSEVL